MRSKYDLIDLDVDFYKSKYPDLSALDDEQARRHYFEFGYKEGRESNRYCLRDSFVRLFAEKKILEIGPFANPLLRHSGVRYCDVLSAEELRRRALSVGLNPADVPHIDYVLRDCGLESISDRFDVLVSSHNIEHQPDLISHLNDAAKLLDDGGVYALIIPNARYCFDAGLPLSKISEVLNAFYEKRKIHSVGAVVEHRALTVHNNAEKHWLSEGIHKEYIPIDSKKVKSALMEFESSSGSYIDVHAWQFDPLSFSDIVNVLIDVGLLRFRGVECAGPVYGRNEFVALLRM